MQSVKIRTLILATILGALGGSALDAILNLGDSFDGELCKPSQVDFVEFDALHGMLGSFLLDTGPGGFTPRMKIVDVSTGDTLLDTTGVGSTLQINEVVFPSSGKYQLRIASGDGGSGTYSLTTGKNIPLDLLRLLDTQQVATGRQFVERFQALAGWRMAVQIRPGESSPAIPTNVTLTGPNGPIPLTGFVVPIPGGVSIPQFPLGLTSLGNFTLRVTNTGGTGDLKSVIRLQELIPPTTVVEQDDCSLFGPASAISGGSGSRSVFAADVDGDLDLDVINTSRVAGRVEWQENTGTGWLSRTIVNAGGAFGLHAGDLDGDLDVDVLYTSLEDNGVHWARNNGSGTFSTQPISTSMPVPTSVFAADLDGDLDLDVLATSRDDDTVVWYENTDGLGTFADRRVVTFGQNAPLQVRAADLDGDLDLDVLVCSRDDDRVSWYENLDGAGNFGPGLVISFAVDTPRDVIAADIDGDLDLDVAAVGSGDGLVRWFRNLDGAGTFGPPIPAGASPGGHGLYAADFDLDGDLDLVSTALATDSVVWHQNLNGFGTFAPAVALPTSISNPVSVYAADLDGDGDDDVLTTANGGSLDVFWYENRIDALDLQLVIGEGPGASHVLHADRLFDTLVAPVVDVVETHPVHGAQVLLPSSGLNPDETPAWAWQGTFTAQLVSWDPAAPGRPNRASNAVAVHIQADGQVFTESFGEPGGLSLRVETGVDAAGRATLLFLPEAP